MELAITGHCVICKRACNLFNYGANCCNACKMFFRRIKVGREPKPCLDPEKCSRDPKPCRYCRYQTCLAAGMSIPAVQIHSAKYEKVCLLINNLTKLHEGRRDKLLNQMITGDPTFEEAVLGDMEFQEKPPDLKLDLFDWVFNAAVTGIDYFKKFQFVSGLELSDRKNMLKSIYVNANLLSCAFCAYQSNRHFMSFPDGCDVVPYTSDQISHVLENNIRCRLTGKLIELRISREEYLLLNVVLACNPASTNLSPDAKSLVSTHQKYYSNSLLQHCLITYQQNGPSRFFDLLSVCQTIQTNVQDVMHHNMLYRIYEPGKDINLRRKFFE